MKAHPWIVLGGFLGLFAAAITVSQWTRWGVVGLIALAMLGWLLSFRCRHRYATLLPPVRDGGPERDHARWYCDRCGETWDSKLEPSTRPRVIYEGHDERKAVLAAERAESLDKQRRRLATKRGATTRPRPASTSLHPALRPVEAGMEVRPFAARRRS